MYTLKKGDCLQLMDAIPDGSVDMVLCDLPYGNGKTSCGWDSTMDAELLWRQYARVCKPNGAIVLFCSQPFTTQLIHSGMGFFKYCLVWNKRFSGSFVQAKRMPLRTHEDIAVFSFGGTLPTYNPQMVKRDKPIKAGGNKPKRHMIMSKTETDAKAAFDAEKKDKIYDEKYPISILEFSNREDPDRGIHPTQKPTALCEYLVRTYTNEGDLVLDNTTGSGTTGVACDTTGRRFYGIELNDYFEAAEKSIQDAYWNGQLVLPNAADAFDAQW